MTIFNRGLRVALLMTAVLGTADVAMGAGPQKSVVLVHGAWADGSSWSEVVPYLQAAGLNVVAVQNPLMSLKGDVANTVRVIQDQPGDVVLVGHSYGGEIITEAGNDPKVKALVYVAAFAPAPGQSVNDILSAFPAPVWFKDLHADAGGYVSWPLAPMTKYFASGLPAKQVEVLAATQHPTFGGVNDEKIGPTVAYSSKPAWSVVSEEDLIIPAALQMHFAEVMKSTVVPVKTGHLPMFKDPKGVAAAIIAAAKTL
jgi:pimeloyl-ACP methyl ester carboxylesterase